jgi:hypothetical protein
VYVIFFLIFGTKRYRLTATLIVLFILSDTTVPKRAPRGNLRGGEWIKPQPGIVEVSASSSLDIFEKSSSNGVNGALENGRWQMARDF